MKGCDQEENKRRRRPKAKDSPFLGCGLGENIHLTQEKTFTSPIPQHVPPGGPGGRAAGEEGAVGGTQPLPHGAHQVLPMRRRGQVRRRRRLVRAVPSYSVCLCVYMHLQKRKENRLHLQGRPAEQSNPLVAHHARIVFFSPSPHKPNYNNNTASICASPASTRTCSGSRCRPTRRASAFPTLTATRRTGVRMYVYVGL